MPAITRSLRSSARLSAATPERKTLAEKIQPAAKVYTDEDESAESEREKTVKASSTKAKKKRKAEELKAKVEDDAKPKSAAGKKETAAKKSKDELKALRDAPVPDINPAAERRDPPETKYWLMKSEPEDKLTVAGIRNYAARNNLRAMRKGDQAFFYHSNCKEPGIVGIMSITKEHSPDWNACINDNSYYDDSAPHDGSKWSLVHVKIEHKFPKIVPLSLLKEVGPKGPLQNMQLLKLGRLSVNKVTEEEWNEIIRMAKELDTDNEWDETVEQSKKFPNYHAA
ncbi:Thymocyte nuclear protein 1 [Colletotrichum spinosum]|uniref:Thymocyte nuclear protein 1 n=1 Tax=Colletotrichum spinosum TaxID=1347390 RepID=A0A4V3HQA1_9PEZI|nr:Thymocyte nuclear protein 1 [Colletotrichum spinosum]